MTVKTTSDLALLPRAAGRPEAAGSALTVPLPVGAAGLERLQARWLGSAAVLLRVAFSLSLPQCPGQPEWSLPALLLMLSATVTVMTGRARVTDRIGRWAAAACACPSPNDGAESVARPRVTVILRLPLRLSANGLAARAMDSHAAE